MNFRKLGHTDFEVSEVGLGCWQFGGDFGPIENRAVHEILDAAVESGVNFFDTADVYGAGASERYLGEHFAGLETSPYLVTKYGRGEKTYPDKYSLENLRDAIKRSQDRLQRDCLDLIQLHCIPLEVTAHGAIFDWLRTVQQEGHIRYFGASVETIEEGLVCAQQDDLASIQVIFNLFRQKPIEELLPRAQEKEIGIIVRLPLASGLLAGKFDKNTTFAETDHRNYNRDGEAFNVGETFAGISFEKGLDLVGALKELVPGQYSMAEFAMRWILDHEAVSTVIPGASSAEQVRRNAAACALAPLSEATHQKVKKFYQDEVAAHIRGTY